MFMHARLASTLAIGAAVAWSAAAHAADNTRYVSITGSNANACTLAAPCRTFQRGINVTPAGGELQMLDSGDFGVNATIRKSLTVNGNGHTVYLANPITIDQDGIVVAVRNIVLDGQGTVTHGIHIKAAAAAHVERCVVRQFADSGIRSEGGNETDIFVLDTIARNNGASGLILAGSLVGRNLTVDNSRFEGNVHHGVAANVIEATITRSIMSANGIDGVHQTGFRMNVTATTSAHNVQNGYFLNAAQMTLKNAVGRGNGAAGLRV
jgi:hypothetical protein